MIKEIYQAMQESERERSLTMRIRILTENTVYKKGLLGEHGLSLLIEEQGRRFLFDSGQTNVYLKNAEKLKESLADLDGIILSHGHYDHCGGLEYFPEQTTMPPVYVREKAFEDKRSWNGVKKEYNPIGISWDKNRFDGAYIYTGRRYEICEHFTLIGEIEYETDFEKKPDNFFIGEGTKPDCMADEQLLVVETPKGLCLFMGCSHMGIINCVRRVEREFPGQHIHSILAGMHLNHCSMDRIDRTIKELELLGFDYIIPVHCTGMRAIVRMKEKLGDRCILGEAGKQIEL